jgi:hypothetical protein
MQAEVRGWFIAAWGCLAALVAVAAWVVPRCIVICDATLTEVREPQAWRAWPIANTNALQGTCVRERDRDDGMSRAGVHLFDVAWGGWVRQDAASDVFVFAAAPLSEEAPNERFIQAFSKRPEKQLVFPRRRDAASIGAIGLALALLVAGILVARHRLGRAEGFARSVQGAYAALGSDPPEYRSPAVAHLPATVGLCLADGARGAKRALATAFVAAVVVFGVFVMCMGRR